MSGLRALFLTICAVVLSSAAALSQQGAVRTSPSPAPTASPASASFTDHGLTIDPVISMSALFTSGANATGNIGASGGMDQPARLNVSSALYSIAKSTGVLRYGLTLGAYAFPTVGVSGNATLQTGANSELFGPIPNAYITYVPSANLSVTAGNLWTVIGSESAFTYQNINIERGLGWNAEPVVSRGVRVALGAGKFTGSLGLNDGFYSGSLRALEGDLALAPNAASSLSFAFLVPPADTPANATASVANKREYNPMYSVGTGRWQISPYALFVDSPACATLGYSHAEHATYVAVLASYALTSRLSLGMRAEYAQNASAQSDTSPNADLVGYGPGSGADSYTLTPGFRSGPLFARAELSDVLVRSGSPGLLFGTGGTRASQLRGGLELGVQY